MLLNIFFFRYFLTPEIITNSPFRIYIFWIAWICLYLLTKSADMYIYSSRITRIFISPYNIQKVLSAVYLTWIHSKQFQKIELFGGQINLFPPDDHTSAFTVDLHLTFDDYFIILLIFITLTDPAYDCFNPCFDFQNIKRLCYVLIELMGGTIEISSEVGVGSTFNIQIPLDIDKDPQARERADEQADSCSLAGMNVLLAEDNELNAEIAQALLESEGIVVTRAADGNEAVDLYVGRPAGSFDAILMDIMMPGMDGYEATRAIRLSEKVDAADIPIIALTANAFAEDAQAAHAAGMNAHLSKPLDFNRLKNILARIKKNGSVSL